MTALIGCSKLSLESNTVDKTGLVEIERSLYGKDDPDQEVQRSVTVKVRY